jgi:hypothetical protein
MHNPTRSHRLQPIELLDRLDPTLIPQGKAGASPQFPVDEALAEHILIVGA